jgi:hypothetical protein
LVAVGGEREPFTVVKGRDLREEIFSWDLTGTATEDVDVVLEVQRGVYHVFGLNKLCFSETNAFVAGAEEIVILRGDMRSCDV